MSCRNGLYQPSSYFPYHAPPASTWQLPPGHYYGNINGPAKSHGGYYASEKPWVKWIQQGLLCVGHYLFGMPTHTSGWADGIWGSPTDSYCQSVIGYITAYQNQPAWPTYCTAFCNDGCPSTGLNLLGVRVLNWAWKNLDAEAIYCQPGLIYNKPPITSPWCGGSGNKIDVANIRVKPE